MRKAFLRAAVALVALLVVGGLALTAVVSFKVLFPTPGSDRHADVIVSLAPGYNRLPTALELYNAGQGDELAVTWIPTEITPADAGYEFVQLEEETCREVTDPHLHCYAPVEVNTLGEALAVHELAAQHGWGKVTVVTSRYHAFRTNYIFERCLAEGTDVEVIATPTDLPWHWWLYRLTYENAAFVKAVLETEVKC